MTVFATPGPITVTLTTAGARVRIAASERPDTVVRVEAIDGESKADVKVAEGVKVAFSDGELAIKTTKSGGKHGSVAITIDLPVGSRLVLNTAWTDVHAYGRLGDCGLDVASGQIQLDRLATLRGNLATGRIAIGHIAGSVDIEGGSAGVWIGEVDGAVRYQGSTGKVWIGRARSAVDLAGASGSFDIDHVESGVVAKAGNCPIRVGRLSNGRAELVNAAGGIEVGISAGAAAWVDAESTKGIVRSSLSAEDIASESDSRVKVYARTRLDDIVIRHTAA
ncbi:DUF4097 family beta strand repeat-containing protein [Amycolatopsis pittospori]|uniref:hypothetical protein n=1 Tax=Amycolatopsis pittospori TaxID=2749434 RepID=UPI0015F0BFC1|nr:hypothetical protein [Amycolatopsis pittospori]